ncbi:sodium- and chloride-dependent GABA transporter 2-like [Oncorhynchus nerka]|uniref:sodium- and chloride-dependent GABA transporter 2-like n=1 Tax=Oncorhynchus nerka TaxID=8023 RepID=UPI0011311457|nr:sodium- and chloride-dependent GABA transporter 2-like [Oncorhynchus nerka]
MCPRCLTTMPVTEPVCSPSLCSRPWNGYLVSFICSLVEYQHLTFNRWYVYPGWVYVLGWLLALSSIVLVPVGALLQICTGTGRLRAFPPPVSAGP